METRYAVPVDVGVVHDVSDVQGDSQGDIRGDSIGQDVGVLAAWSGSQDCGVPGRGGKRCGHWCGHCEVPLPLA